MGGSRGEWVSVLVMSGGPWRGEGEVVSERVEGLLVSETASAVMK